MSLSSANRSMQLLVRLLDPKNTTEPLIDFGPQKPVIPIPEKSLSLPRASAERHGIPSRHIAAFLQALQDDPTLGMHSVLIGRNGKRGGFAVVMKRAKCLITVADPFQGGVS